MQFLSYLLCFLVCTLLNGSMTYANPLDTHLESESSLCPTSWYHYGRFCVGRAPAGSDRVVALYCDGLGGIGINGLCIIKAGKDLSEDTAAELESPPEYAALFSSPGLAKAIEVEGVSALGDDPEDEEEVSAPEDDIDGVSGLCPRGWSHFQSLCVYKPWQSGEECHNMNAVYFRGMCLKHAETRETDADSRRQAKTTNKRACCCAHPNAPSNNYSC